MDCIYLTGIRCYSYLGALPEEQVLGQWFEVDLTLWLDLSKAGESDHLDDTIDYGRVVALVQQLVKTAKVALLERMATMIADAILQSYSAAPPVQQVQVRLSKLTAPIPDFDGKVTIEIVRCKAVSPLG